MQLSAYIGLRAIAWIASNGKEVIQYGIKRVNISFDSYYEYIAGLPVSKRINRRMKKQTRRNLWRYRSRRKNLKNILNKYGYDSNKEMNREELLKLRVKGLTEQLTKEELYPVLMSLQQKRGYKRLRGSSEEKIRSYSEEIEKHQAKMDEQGADAYMSTLFPNETIRVEYNEQQLKNYRSIAEYLLTLPSSRNLIFNRSSYEKEFNEIMDHQNIQPSFREKIFNIIYWQHPLKKGKVGKCMYEQNRTVTHASNPLYQEFRIWRDIMNIVIYDGDKNEVEVSFDLRKKWVDKLMKGTNLTKAGCCKDLGYKHSASFTWYSGNMIAGNPVIGEFTKLMIEEKYHAELWHDLFSATDDQKLYALLKNKYPFSDYQVDELSNLDLHKLGYADFSTKAIKKLLPHLQQSKKLKQAILDVYGKIDFNNVALRNVVLEQHFESYKSLVNVLRQTYSIDEIKFEIDHLLKQGNKGRKEIAKNKRKEEKWLKENERVLAGKSSYDILKYKLWQECEGISPYEPHLQIPLQKLFSKEYNIDHAIAKSTLFETGYQNMVLCKTKLNEKKNRMTALDFARSIGLNGEYDAAVEKFPEGKKQFLLMKEEEIPNDWLSRRQNNDYNTKCFATISPLSKLGEGQGVRNIPNKLINKYLNEWKLNRYKEDDARHYLCKAFIIANFSQQTIDYFDNIKKQTSDCYKLNPDIPFIDFENAPVFVPRIKFTRCQKASFRDQGYTPRFALHGESVYGKRVEKKRNAKGEWVEQVYYKIRQPLTKLTANMVENIMDGKIKSIIEAGIASAGSIEKAIESFIENPPKHNGKPIKSVSVRINAEKVFPLHSTDGKGHTAGKNVYDKKIDYVFSDKNYCLSVWQDEKGRMKKGTTALIDFIDIKNAGNDFTAPGMILKENDILELHGQQYYIIGASEALALRPVYTLSATNTYRVKADDWKHLKKIHVNQLGEITSISNLHVDSKNS